MCTDHRHHRLPPAGHASDLEEIDGFDVAALTDHATLSDKLLGDVVQGLLPPEYTQVGA
jgi:hypothetical protein